MCDNGPGINPSFIHEMLHFSEKPKRMQRARDDLTEFDCSEHGVGFRLNTMRLASKCLVISKFKAKNQIGIHYVSIGLI
jgi:hypothetical protein